MLLGLKVLGAEENGGVFVVVGQLQAGQVVFRFRGDCLDGQAAVGGFGGGKDHLGVIIGVLCGDAGVAAAVGGQGVGAVIVLADLRAGGVINPYRHARFVHYGQGHGGCFGDGKGIGGRLLAFRRGHCDDGGRLLRLQGEGIAAVLRQRSAIHRDGIAAGADGMQHHVGCGDGAAVVLDGAGEADVLPDVASRDIQAGEGGGAL